MKWQILAIGKPSLRYAKGGVEEYQKRLTRYTTLELQTDWKDAGQVKNSETLLAASEGAVRIVLDERGETWTTADLVSRVEGWQMNAVKRVAILIGGADGHTPELRSSADHVIALSGFTLQHELALVVLLEQIYRVHTVLRGEPYHR
ncbi:MAG: 23S rRNA (pseudouridine(1915)-N(3))-methyltransferase RlmH [Verrucomicrobiales bacterium]|nr:23S rRNA (pseudouridine(1915)-N(3))-methyltransferase RlmH [Verrucomicrobiales bacterium]MDP4792817.1 23S rRNA (pseudouridine(1915)-N(3))-methyltransferase RlmH [Verrucomicrobiales bacterium]MDP4937794.1 23S rRNA (pseudouridine(1915)-N(3))-methyltransferase RlmH [Verrucomicrobiales bacterium]MDP5005887.1 23S rRNA (pseudouridine(1915)-N(3))-methyltransferase RlmH [Verrucomicrobiales bacterium]